MPISFDRNVLGESFGQFFFWNHLLNLGLGAGQGLGAVGWGLAGGWGLGAGLGLGAGGWGLGAGGWALKRKLVYSKMKRNWAAGLLGCWAGLCEQP